jgi:hypothetical protein
MCRYEDVQMCRLYWNISAIIAKNIRNIFEIKIEALIADLAKAFHVQLCVPPHKWDGNEYTIIAVGFSQRIQE